MTDAELAGLDTQFVIIADGETPSSEDIRVSLIEKSRLLVDVKQILINGKPILSQRVAEGIAFDLWGIAGEQTRHIVEATLTQTLERYNFELHEITALIDVVEAEMAGTL